MHSGEGLCRHEWEARSAFPEWAAVWRHDGGKVARAWPLRRGGKINSQWSELTSWGQEGMGKTLWGGGAPPRLYEMVKAEQEKSAAVEQHGDRSESGFLIFLVLTDRRRSRLQSVIPPFFGRGKKRWNDAGGVKVERHSRELFQGQHQGWRKGNILTAWAPVKKKKSRINMVEIGWALILKINVITVVCPSTHVVPLDGFTAQT